jgi:uncharacterized protein (DUF427 family)
MSVAHRFSDIVSFFFKKKKKKSTCPYKGTEIRLVYLSVFYTPIEVDFDGIKMMCN